MVKISDHPNKPRAPRTDRETVFKVWCRNNNISQNDIVASTSLSAGCVHHLWTDGSASKSTIKLLSLVYGINEGSLENLIHTFNTDPKITSKLLNKIKTIPSTKP